MWRCIVRKSFMSIIRLSKKHLSVRIIHLSVAEKCHSCVPVKTV